MGRQIIEEVTSPDGAARVEFWRRGDGLCQFETFLLVSEPNQTYWTSDFLSGLHPDYGSARDEAEARLPWLAG